MYVPRSQQWVVDEQRSRADGYRVNFGPHRVRVPVRVFRGDWSSFTFTGRQSIVEACSRFHDHERALSRLECEIRTVES